MKKYIIFAYDQYYPNGGLADILDSDDDLSKAIKTATDDKSDWWQIVDRDTWKIIISKD